MLETSGPTQSPTNPPTHPPTHPKEIPERLMSMVLHTLEARLWSAAWDSRTMPSMIAALLAPDSAPREEHINYMEDLWKASVLVESQYGTGSGPQDPCADLLARLACGAVAYALVGALPFSKASQIGVNRSITLHTHVGHEDGRGNV